MSAAPGRPARAPCTRRTSRASSGPPRRSAPRAPRAPRRRASAPARDRPRTRMSSPSGASSEVSAWGQRRHWPRVSRPWAPWSQPWSGAGLRRRGRGLVAGQRAVQLLARADAELGEHLAQVPLDRARADEQHRGDLRVGVPAGGQPPDLRLLRRELVEHLGAAPAHRLAGGQELAAGALGEAVGAHLDEHPVREAQLLAGVYAAVLAAQPLTIEKVGAGEREPDARAAE